MDCYQITEEWFFSCWFLSGFDKQKVIVIQQFSHSFTNGVRKCIEIQTVFLLHWGLTNDSGGCKKVV